MSKYTIELHAERVRDMLDSVKNVDGLMTSCPATETFYVLAASIPEALDDEDKACRVCRTFVDIPEKEGDVCPCDYYEYDEAIAITRRKLLEWKD